MSEEIKQEQFLSEYLKNKNDWVLLDLIFDTCGDWIGQNAGNNNLNIFITEENNKYICKIYSIELNYSFIAKFILPENFQDFKTIMDIFLKEISK